MDHITDDCERLTRLYAGAEPIGTDPSIAKRERLRDEMAMAALSGIASMHGLNVSLESSLIATCCYEVADAMLKAREAK